jgi:hypothetical protein
LLKKKLVSFINLIITNMISGKFGNETIQGIVFAGSIMVNYKICVFSIITDLTIKNIFLKKPTISC